MDRTGTPASSVSMSRSAMQGTNHDLYRRLQEAFPALQFVASGGVSSMEDVRKLASANLYGAIIGKAYYIGAIDLKEACEEVQV